MSTSLINAPDDVQTFQEACATLRSLEDDSREVLSVIHERSKDLILIRFRQGKVASRALDMGRQEHYGESVIKTLAQEANMHHRTLYQARQFAEHPQFSGSEIRLRRWMDEKEEEKGRLTWTYCRNWAKKALPASDDEAEDALEEQKDKLSKKAQRLEKSAQDLEQEAEDLRQEVERRNESAEETEEADGVALQARQVAEDLRRQAERLRVKQAGRIESPEYLGHVREHGCIICTAEADAHHLETGGMGTKCHDLFTVPLCREHHNELHQWGQTRFAEDYGIELWKVAAYLQAEYITGLELIPRR